MAQRATAVVKAQVVREGSSQSVRLPPKFRLQTEEVYVRRDVDRNVLEISEEPFPKSWEEIFAMCDALDWSGFDIERDHTPPREVNL